MSKVEFLGVKIDAISMEETLKIAESYIKSNKPHQHVVVNVAKIVEMKRNKELFDDVASADIINADGMGIVWGARLLGKKIPERVTGIDLFMKILKLAEIKGYRPFFFGAKQDVLENMIGKLRKSYPKLKIAGYRNGYYKEAEQEKIAKEIKKTKARILIVGISSPMKERFIRSQLKNTGVSFAMGVGGSFDIVAGKTKRAPGWMQKAGLEWFFRLLQEPKRMFMRYFRSNISFCCLILKEKFKSITHLSKAR